MKNVSSGNFVQSDTFTVGGYQWVIEFYPQGWNSSYYDFVSIIVRLTNTSDVVNAIFTHRLLDWNTSNWSTDTPATSDVETFLTSGYSGWGYFDFITRFKLEKSNYLRSDTLMIKTSLWVTKDSLTVLSSVAGHLYSTSSEKILPTANV